MLVLEVGTGMKSANSARWIASEVRYGLKMVLITRVFDAIVVDVVLTAVSISTGGVAQSLRIWRSPLTKKRGGVC
jgi:hypothetical protein